MKLKDYKVMFNLKTKEEFKAHCERHNLSSIYSCEYCDEIMDPINPKLCCWAKARD